MLEDCVGRGLEILDGWTEKSVARGRFLCREGRGGKSGRVAPSPGWDSEDPAEPPPAKEHEHKYIGAAPREGPPTPHPSPGCGGTRHPFPNLPGYPCPPEPLGRVPLPSSAHCGARSPTMLIQSWLAPLPTWGKVGSHRGPMRWRDWHVSAEAQAKPGSSPEGKGLPSRPGPASSCLQTCLTSHLAPEPTCPPCPRPGKGPSLHDPDVCVVLLLQARPLPTGWPAPVAVAITGYEAGGQFFLQDPSRRQSDCPLVCQSPPVLGRKGIGEG